jgi:hypothetical protein
VNNRGRKLLFPNLCAGTFGNNDPRTLADVGNALPLRMGFTIVWSGWDPDAPRANNGIALTAPVAPIAERIRDEFVSGTRMGELATFRLSHEAASLVPREARLTVRRNREEPRRDIGPGEWAFVDHRSVRLLPEGRKPEPGAIYELDYVAQNPKVQGIGFAATRDVVSHLRYAPAAVEITRRPMRHALAFGISQGGRYLRHHIGAGFNGDEQGRRVFDGILTHVAGAGRIFFNVPFGQPFRTNTRHEDRDFPENEFPFSAAYMADPISGRSGALLQGDDTDPLLIQTNTSTEYWQKGASLLHTDPIGTRDVVLPETTRVFMLAGTNHTGRASQTSEPGPCANRRNAHDPMPALRALLVALDQWVSEGKAPPASRVPTIAGGTLVSAEQCGFPSIPGAVVARVTNEITLGDRAYHPLVCKVDADGNEVAGIRLPDIAVPLGSYTGWNLYKAPYPEGALADREGSFIAFAETPCSGDLRLSLADRYPVRAGYVAKVKAVVADLLAARLLLAEDAARYVERAEVETRISSSATA